MASVPRFWGVNTLFTGAHFQASSETGQFPAKALEDQQRTYPWRTATGWTITEHNRYLDFDRGGVKVATVATGTYATGAALATAITAALEAADATPVWAADYGSTSAGKFTINGGTGHSLLWQSGTNAYRSIGRSLGFTVSADDTGLTSYTADSVSYQSTHDLHVQLPAALLDLGGPTCASLIGSNVTAAGSAVLASSIDGTWASPTTLVTFTGGDERDYFEYPEHAYYRLRIDDPTNADGYGEVGVLYLAAGYTASPHFFSVNQSRSPFDYSTIQTAPGGNHFKTTRLRQKRWSLSFVDVADAEAVELRAFFDTTAIGQNFVLDFSVDVPRDGGGFSFGQFPDTVSETMDTSTHGWDFNFAFWEAL